eukprot:6210686-Pleurochrysis_carterae.AAC.3
MAPQMAHNRSAAVAAAVAAGSQDIEKRTAEEKAQPRGRTVAETAALAQSERVEAAERADDEAVAVAYHTQSARASDASYGTSCGRAIRCGK